MSLRLDLEQLDLHVVLVEPEIPPNTGNIGRLCVGVGATLHLVGKLGFSTDDAALRRAGLDYWHHLRVRYHDGLEDLWEEVPQEKFHYLTTRADRPYTEATYRRGDYLVFGSESKGLPEGVLSRVGDRAMTIPMTGRIRSHNLGNAASIIVYEAIRQLSPGLVTPGAQSGS